MINDKHIENQTNKGSYQDLDLDNNNNNNKSKSWKGVLFFLFSISIVAGIVIAILYLTGQFNKSSTTSSQTNSNSIINNTMIPNKTSDIKSCPIIPLNKRIIIFWQSEVEGCSTIPDGVTHVIWGFSEINFDTKKVSLSFQGHDTTLKKCILDLRKRCISSLASIGGANNKLGFTKLNEQNYNTFADSILTLIKEYQLDGIDIDDETVGKEYNETRTIGYLKAVSTKLKTNNNNYIITFDSLIYDGVSSRCNDSLFMDYSRCYTQMITNYVDWIHIMAYNVALNTTQAENIYSNAISKIFSDWLKLFNGKNLDKLVFGVCVLNGCAYGPGPSDKIIMDWTVYQKKLQAGGMMIYSGSSDKSNNYNTIKNILTKI